ncbi:extracellular solute-binding protein [Jiangella asiatica]|uniref:Extracellular solute-binding protein n=1 Tax=Jiangella asiatica TaxID=2530372 RepID=A0A4R5CLV9_9ACTN|nr:extracellular solute-binding protein [Jiangella asiatica]TDE00220.1 extracellular solute-binding protein [Jiangella asiatica]
MMGWGSDVEKQGVQAAVESFNEGRDATVTYQFVPNDGYDTKMNTLVAANNLPDLSYQAEGTAMRLGAQGKVANVLDYVDTYSQLADLLPTVVHQWDEGSGLTQLAVEMMLLWYNVDAIDDAGVPRPPATAADAWSWDEFVQYADRLTVDANGRHPSESGFDTRAVEQWGTLAPTGWPGFFPLLKSNGADIVDENGTGYVLDSPEAVEVITRIHDLIYVHRVAPTPAQFETIASTFTAGLLENRRVAMVLDGQWNLLDLGQMDFAYSLGVLPKFGEPKTVNLCNAVIVAADSEDVDSTMELLIHLGDPARNDLYAKGLWMPLQSTYYTDPEAIASWTDNPVHPPEYKTAALDYLVENGEPEPAYRIKNWDRIGNLFTADLDGLFASSDGGGDRVRQVLEGIRPKVEPLLEGVYPDTLES